MQRVRSEKNNHLIKKAGVFFITNVLIICVLIPVVYSVHVTSFDKPSEESNVEKTLLSDNWWDNNWPYRKLSTIDHNQINDDQFDFPFLLHINSDTDLADHAQDNGDDIVFILYSDNTTQLNHEIEFFNSSTGKLIAWVNVPGLSSIDDTKIWIYYGNNICNNQENIEDTWDSNFVMVQHLNEQSETLFDSTYNNNDGIANGSTYNSTAKIGGAYNFDGINDYIDVGKFDVIGGGLTLSVWFNANFLSSTCSGSRLISKAAGHSSYMHYWMIGVLDNGNKFRFRLKTNVGGTTQQTLSTGGINTGEWYQFVATYDGSKMEIFKDGVLLGTTGKTGTISTSNSTFDWIGSNPPDIYEPWNGVIDEVHISNIARDNNWIYLSYKNQNNPESFISVSSQELCEYTLTINIEGNGSVLKNPDQTTYTYGTIVELTAVPDTGWSFSHWSGDLNGSNNPEYITMNGDKNITANFSINHYNLTIDVIGQGEVIKDPDLTSYPYGTVVELTAVPDEEWSFSHWSGDLNGSNNPEYITVDENKSITAHFSINEYTLTVNIIGEGTVLKDPDYGSYPFGSMVELTAVSDEGWIFEYWSGDLSGNENPKEILIDADKVVNAHFKEDDIFPEVEIIRPDRGIYILNEKRAPFIFPIIFNEITIEANASDEDSGLEKVEFYIDGELRETDNERPYSYHWNDSLKRFHTIEAIAYDNAGNTASDSLKVFLVGVRYPLAWLVLVILIILLTSDL